MKFIKKFYVPGISILFFCILFSLPHLIKIKKISCFSQSGNCSDRVTEVLKPLRGKSLSQARKEAGKVLQKEFLVNENQVSYKFPDLLDIKVIERRPKYTLSKIEKKSFLLVDKEGFILSESQSNDFPGLTITETEFPPEGTYVKNQILFALKIMDDIYSLYGVKNGFIENNSLLIELPESLRVIFPLEGDREVLIGSVMFLYNEIIDGNTKIKQADGKIGTIDLRFRNPVLKPI